MEKKAPNNRIRYIAIAIAITLTVAVLLLALRMYREGMFLLSRIDIQGETRIDAKEIVSLSGLTSADSVLFISKKHVTARIEANPLLIVTRVKKKYPDAILIYVKERAPVALARDGGGFIELSGDAMLTTRQVARYDYPVISGLSLTVSNGYALDPDLRAIARILSNMIETTNGFYDMISELRYGAYDVHLYLKHTHIEALLDRAFTEEKLTGIYGILLHQGENVKKIDYRFTNPVIQ